LDELYKFHHPITITIYYHDYDYANSILRLPHSNT